MPTFEEQYEDVLQNIEFGIVSVYRKYTDMTDWTVDAALEALIRAYSAERGGRSTSRARLDALEQEVYDRVKAMCEWRLGREQPVIEGKGPEAITRDMTPKTLDEIIACLKRVRKSVDYWTKGQGRQGYLAFVSQYIH